VGEEYVSGKPYLIRMPNVVDMNEVELAFVVQERLVGLHAEEGDWIKSG